MDDEKGKLVFQDPDDPEKKIALIYHDPSTDEWFKFRAKFHLAVATTETGSEERLEKLYRLNFDSGISILESFSDPAGLLGLSSEENGWKEKIGNKAPDLIIELGVEAFHRKEFVPEKNS